LRDEDDVEEDEDDDAELRPSWEEVADAEPRSSSSALEEKESMSSAEDEETSGRLAKRVVFRCISIECVCLVWWGVRGFFLAQK
jgi:hypothetical protein